MKAVHVRIEGRVVCADDLTRDDLYRMLNEDASRLFGGHKDNAYSVAIVSIEAWSPSAQGER